MPTADLLREARETRDLLRTDPPRGRERLAALAARAELSPLHGVVAELLRGWGAYFEGRYADADAIGRAAHATAVEVGAPRLCAELELLIGNVALERGEFDEATSWYTAAGTHIEPLGEPMELGRVYNNLGLVAWRMRDLSRAEAHFDHALRLFGPDADPRTLGILHNNLGCVFLDSGDPGAADAAFRRAIAMLAPTGDDNFHANALSNLGEILESKGDLAGARALLEQALALQLRVGHLRGGVDTRIALARVTLALGGDPAGYIEDALALARQTGLRKQEADALVLRASALERAGDLAAALHEEREAARLREEVFGEQMTERVASLQLRFEAWQARTQARRAEEANARLQQAMTAAEAAAEARGRFLAMMSHEMRTPLTAVIGAAELLRLGNIDHAQRHLVDVVSASAEALLATINDVLDFTRAEAGRLELTAEAVSPRDVADQVLSIVSGAADAKGLPVRVFVADDVPERVWSDHARLRQVLLNLVANAVKFTERGAVELRIDRAGASLRAVVIDTGVGIPPDAAVRVFEPFTQADASPTRRHGGTGLGLAICKRIVDAMGGTIAFTSTPDVGTTFTVTLPLDTDVPRVASEPPRPPVRTYAALLVEDDDGVREVIAELLGWCGAEVTAVPSAHAAIEAFAASPPDVVVLDIHMPVMDGLTCARILRERHGHGVPILGLSGATTDTDRRAVDAAGLDGWLAKPTSLRQLREELTRLGLLSAPPPASAAPA